MQIYSHIGGSAPSNQYVCQPHPDEPRNHILGALCNLCMWVPPTACQSLHVILQFNLDVTQELQMTETNYSYYGCKLQSVFF